MLVTNHVLSGALIGYVVPNPAASFAVGVVSHLLLDAVPHWGVGRPIHELMHVAVPDGLIGATAMAVLTATSPPERRPAVLAGMAGAAFPDLDKPSTVFFGTSPFPRSVDAFHQRIQRESPRRMPQELAVGLASVIAVGLLSRRRGGREAGRRTGGE
jgi:hypothetical protein